jgi:glycosyltransferase involved in cell wall biosynthesis
LKIILTVERYFPQIGGAERVVQRLAEGLAGLRHEVIVVTSGPRSSELVGGVRVERFPVRGNLTKGMRGPVKAALALIQNAKPDVVFNYAAQTWTTDACAQLLATSTPFVHVLAPCGFSALNNPQYSNYFKRMHELLPRYDALVFHSTIYQDWEFALQTGALRMHVIRNGADEASPRASATPTPLCVTIGSHVRSKGHHDFIHAINVIAETHDVSGAIVAPSRAGLEFICGCQARCSFAAARSGGLVELRDGRESHVVESALGEAELFLFPSSIECAPLVILEAMAAGVPWISYDVGNVRELPGGVVVGGYDELVATAVALLDDPSARRRLGAEGRAGWQANHQWGGIIESYEQLFVAAREAERRDAPRA